MLGTLQATCLVINTSSANPVEKVLLDTGARGHCSYTKVSNKLQKTARGQQEKSDILIVLKAAEQQW
jgi:hypothetical protein